MRSFRTLLKNEMKLNIRNMNMVIFAIILPLVVLVILGFIYGTKPAAEGAAYSFMDQSLGALCSISICAGGLMGLPLVVSEYRERKILKRFKVTLISPVLLLIVEFLIYVLYALVSYGSTGHYSPCGGQIYPDPAKDAQCVQKKPKSQNRVCHR